MSHAHFGDKEIYPGKDCAQCRPTGEQLRDEGVARVEGASDDDMWRLYAWTMLEHLAKDAAVHADDVRAECGSPSHPNSMGALFIAAAKRGLIEKRAIHKGLRAVRHAGMSFVWVRV